MARRFTVIDGFFSEEMRSEYVAGMSYEAEDGSGLSELVDEWIAQGKVREGGPASEVSGGGEVSAEDKSH